jgi:small subunit ribosomal protein S8
MAALTDPIADFLIRIKNAYMAGNEECSAPYSKVKEDIASILKEEGYIWGFDVNRDGKFPVIVVRTRFVDNEPALVNVKRVSRPGRREYVGVGDFPRVISGLGINIISTSKGVMTCIRARKENVGGELLAQVW